MNLLVPLYAVTLFVSALLLFSVQPMVGKYLLPLMGGGPSVWNTAMVFFQILLLGGYAYAHAMARFLTPRTQFLVHLALFLVAAVSLPMVLPEGADPTARNPLLWQLAIMVSMAAAPFFILSSTAPLLQQWFAKTEHKNAGNPYFLYVASNAGSMLALLSYPFVIEPLLTLREQSYSWAYGYGVLGGLILLCGLASKFRPAAAYARAVDDDDEIVTWKRRGAWLLLAFVPSSLMLGVTTFISTDVTTVPLLWVIPLALYLLTFIIAFSEKPFFPLEMTRIVQGVFALVLLLITIISPLLAAFSIVFVHLICFFFTALLCHQELSNLKPKARHLTEFYLIMSLGGALGGVFNSLVAPLLFVLPVEYLIVIALSLFCRYYSSPDKSWALDFPGWKGFLRNWRVVAIAILGVVCALATLYLHKNIVTFIGAIAIVFLLSPFLRTRWIFAILYTAVIIANPLISWKELFNSITIARNYYGVISVNDYEDVRFLTYGVTNHGGQSLNPETRFEPFGYYNKNSALGDVFRTDYMSQSKASEIAVLGLGAGCVACFYNGPGRHFDYYEIDPNVIRIASDPKYFTFLSDCGVDYSIMEGDGRLMIAKQPDQKYDLIMMDAFTSDNIPLHLITREAVEMYLSKIKPQAVALFHVSNRFFRLPPELALIAQSLGKKAYIKTDPGNNPPPPEGKKTNFVSYANIYVVITDNEDVLAQLEQIDDKWTELSPAEGRKPWTDDYANIMRALILQ